jgi:hypothetical protein
MMHRGQLLTGPAGAWAGSSIDAFLKFVPQPSQVIYRQIQSTKKFFQGVKVGIERADFRKITKTLRIPNIFCQITDGVAVRVTGGQSFEHGPGFAVALEFGLLLPTANGSGGGVGPQAEGIGSARKQC